MEDTILEILGNLHYAGLFILLILGGLGFPFPEDVVLILCGFLISMDFLRPVPALLVVYPALLISDFILYALGKKYGRKIVTHKRFQRVLSPERLDALEEKFNRRGVLLILAGRHMAGLRAQLFIVSGIMRMSWWKFLLADAFTALITIAIMVGIGYKGGESLGALEKDIRLIKHIAIFVAATVITAFLLYKYFKHWRGKQSQPR